MKNLKLNLKGLYGYRQSLLSRSPQPRDERETSERRPSEERTLLAPLPQHFARYAAILIMLLTLGFGQMWADECGFWSDGAAHIEFTVNGSTSKTQDLNASDISDLAMGTVTTSLTLKSAWAKVWGVDKFNSITLYYRVKVADASSSAAYSSANIPWGNNWDNNQYWANDNINATININLAPGNYEVEYYFMADAKNESDKYLSNGGSNYHANFTIPSKNLTVAGAANGNTVSGSQTGITKGTAYDITATPTTGYTFGGWSATSGSSSITIANSSSASTKVTFNNYSNNATVTASFNETMSTVTLSASPAGKGTFTIGDAAATSTTAGVTTTRSVTAVPGTGYNFGSWAVSGGATISSISTNPTTVTGKGAGAAATLTCSFIPKTTTITLNKGEHGASNQTATVSYDATALTSITHVAADGMYELIGYFTDGGVKVLNADGSFAGTTVTGYITSDKWSNANAAVTLYAHWDAVSTYSVSYNAGGGTGTMSANTGITAGGSQTISANSFTRSGYTFSHWTANVAVTANSSAVAAGGTIAAGATLSGIGSNIILTAHWTENDYTVTVTAGSNGTVASSSVIGHMDTKVTLPTATANTGYHFSTWTTVTGTVSYDDRTSATAAKVYGLSAAATVRADFAANTYSVVFNKNGGTGTMSNEEFTYGTSKALTSNTFTRSGYTFLGWATSTEHAAALTVDCTDGESVQNLTSENGGTFNLYAVWARKYYIGGRLQHDWEDDSSTTNEMTYVSDGRYKFETNKTVNELSVQWHNSGSYYADQVFFIHTGSGKSGSSSNPFYTTPNEDGAGLNFETSNAYANALVLANQETNWGSIVQNRCVQFSNTDNLSSNVVIWWEPSTKKIWYTATESLNTNYYLLGFGAGNWSETEARRFTVASVNATTATVSVALSAQTYIYNTNNGFKVEKSGTYYGNNSTMTRANCSGWTFATGLNNCGITADVAGTYTFTLDMSTMKVSVTYPTAYTLTFAASPAGATATAPTAVKTSDLTSITSGSTVPEGTGVTLTMYVANAGYTWKGWYDNAEGTGDALGTGNTYATTVDAATTIYAVYTEDVYNVAVSAGANGTVSPTGTVPVSYHTGTTITATPNDNYVFKDWTITGGDITPTSSTAASQLFKAQTTGGTIRANFTPQWAIVGTDEMGDWNIYANGIEHISENVGYVDINLLANTTYTFKVDDLNSSPWYGNIGTMDYGNHSGWTMSQSEGDCHITTAAAGTYRFTFNLSNKQLTVTYPTSYTVTFDVGTTKGASSAPTVSPTVTSGKYVGAGTEVTFTAAAAAAGYRWEGWYDAPTTAGNKLSIDDELTYTIASLAANTTVYAVYTEDTYTVTVTAGSRGTITTPAAPATTVIAGISTAPTITATPDDGAFFSSWEVVSGTATIASPSSATTTVTATSDAVIRANFIADWVIAGIGSWDLAAHGFDYFGTNAAGKDTCYIELDLEANTNYAFKVVNIHNTDIGSGENIWYGFNTALNYASSETPNQFSTSDNDCSLTTAGKGTYRFAWNITDNKLMVIFPTSYTVSYGLGTFYNNDATHDATTTGGTISVTDGDEVALTSGNYVVGGGTAVFTASPAAGYHLAGWYKDAEFTDAYVNGEDGAVIGENTMTLTVSANAAVYAKFAETLTNVTIGKIGNGRVEIGGATVTSAPVGVHTSLTLNAIADAGYYFAGWTVNPAEGADYTVSGTGEDNAEITLSGEGEGNTIGQTLVANFVELEKVYFRNWNEESEGPLWENVYVYFNISWDGKKAVSNSNAALTAVEMQQEGTSNVYWAYVPRTVTRNGYDDIAFSNHVFTTSYGFFEHEAVARGDYKTGWDMYVPQHSNVSVVNSTTYYNGYWKHHNVAVGSDAGYRIERYTGSGYETPADNGGDRLKFIVASENTIQYQLRVDNLSSGYNNYMIYNVGGTHYITFDSSPIETGYSVTTSVNANIGLSEYNSGSPRFYITPTSEGIYTLTIDMTGDVMRLSVNYPVAVGDYMLVHTYNDGSAKKSRSDIIKSTEVSERRYSMFIDNKSAHSPSLVLKKCTSLSDGNPVWDAGTAVSMTGFATAGGFTVDTAGVFVFDVAINNDAATLSNIAVYHGSYYIKTDCADGGWTAYTNNAMEHNTATFVKTNTKTFDYYYCKWVDSGNGGTGGGTNVKCVIANDYCIAVSDTLEGDAILGGEQVLPRAANVRFSYNSTTNALQRAYINGATGWEASFLSMKDARMIKENDNSGYRTDVASIMHFNNTGLTNDTLSFADRNNWIYQVDLRAYETARIKLTANYKYDDTDHYQYFFGEAGDPTEANTMQIIGGTPDYTNAFTMRAIYDFKTNNLITGLLVQTGGDYSSPEPIHADLLVIRDDQNQAQQLTFSGTGALNEVDTVYGILQFKRTTITNTSLSTHERSLYWVSFPFDVKLSDVFGFGEYGTHWIIEYYDGEARARECFWAESDGFWKFVTPAMRDAGYVLKANVGYVVALDLEEIDPFTKGSVIWAHNVQDISLYFPSNGRIGTIDNGSQDVVVPAYTCTNTRDHRNIWDSNWNVIGVPSYANIIGLTEPNMTALRAALVGTQYSADNLRFYYGWNKTTNQLELTSNAGETTFRTMYAYMTQFAGTIHWTQSGGTTSMPAARKNADSTEKDRYTLNLQVAQNDKTVDHTYVEFSDEATEDFDVNQDLVKAANPGITDIYTLLLGNVQMGANCLPVPAAATAVPVGLKAVQEADYTFSMPDGTEGMEVTFIDYAAGTETNLALGSYTVHLNKGSYDNRFALRINRRKVVTNIEAAENGELQTTGNDKVVIDGTLYIRQADGSVFDAQGKRVR